MTGGEGGVSLNHRGVAAWEVSVLVAAVAGGLAYISASQGPWLFEGDDHACMGEACGPPLFVVAWIAQWAIIGLIFSPMAIWYGRRRGRNWAAWSRFALSALPAIIWMALLIGILGDGPEISEPGRIWAVSFPLGLWLAGAMLSALWITRGRPVGATWFTTALVAAGYAFVVAAIALYTLYMELMVMR